MRRPALCSLLAGADLLLMTGSGSFPLVRDAVLGAARRATGRAGAEAAARVLVLRRRRL